MQGTSRDLGLLGDFAWQMRSFALCWMGFDPNHGSADDRADLMRRALGPIREVSCQQRTSNHRYHRILVPGELEAATCLCTQSTWDISYPPYGVLALLVRNLLVGSHSPLLRTEEYAFPNCHLQVTIRSRPRHNNPEERSESSVLASNTTRLLSDLSLHLSETPTGRHQGSESMTGPIGC